MAVPETLAEKMALWRQAGRVEKYSDGLFYDASWIAVYLGQGIVPERHDARAQLPDPAQVARAMNGLREAIVAEVGAMPGHREFLTANAERLAAAP
jgi:tryptophan halogenase